MNRNCMTNLYEKRSTRRQLWRRLLMILFRLQMLYDVIVPPKNLNCVPRELRSSDDDDDEKISHVRVLLALPFESDLRNARSATVSCQPNSLRRGS